MRLTQSDRTSVEWPMRKQHPELRRPRRPPLRVPVAVSPTHAHLTAASIEALFCDHYRLHEHRRLGQPALYEAIETVTLIGPRGRLHKVPVIGPPRNANQVELSSTDALRLGIAAPLRRSGQIVRTPGILIEGPRTSLRLKHGVIRALHHVHMTPGDAARVAVHDGEHVDAVIRVQRPLMFLRDVLVRVSPEFRLELHLDADEANALGLKSGDQVELRKRSTSRAAASALAPR